MAKRKVEKQLPSVTLGADYDALVAILDCGTKEEKLDSLRRIGVLTNEKSRRKGWGGAKQTSPVRIGSAPQGGGG